jgi:NAD(P)-dependent dehydrogenase (short-subunit alcohol dehydrogenase family)
MGNPEFGLEGKGALVVGGGSGIGREAALLLGRAGAKVAVADLDADRAEAVRKEVAELGVDTAAVSGDVTDPDGAESVVGDARKKLGRLDAAVNIVGLASWKSILDLDPETWEHDLRINLHHHLYVGRAAAKTFIADGTDGRLAMVTSVSGLYGAPMHAAYGAAKAGAMALVRSMANEWGTHGIRVNAVAPDIIATPRVKAGFDAQGVTDMNAIPRGEGVPLARWGTPYEIAGPLVFLVSDLAGFMTGQTLVVDGGTQAMFPHTGPKAFSPS